MSAFTAEQLTTTIAHLDRRREQIAWIQTYLKAVIEGAKHRAKGYEKAEEWTHLDRQLAQVVAYFESREQQHLRSAAVAEKALLQVLEPPAEILKE